MKDFYYLHITISIITNAFEIKIIKLHLNFFFFDSLNLLKYLLVVVKLNATIITNSFSTDILKKIINKTFTVLEILILIPITLY